MIITRTAFFVMLFVFIIVPIFTHKLIWLEGSEKTDGTMSFIGKRYAGQMVYTYSVVWFMSGKDTIWFNGRNDIIFREGDKVPVRYQRSNPHDARLNLFLAIWGDSLIYGGIPLLILLIISVHPKIIPYRSKIILRTNKPYITVR